jgi:hypothetical protein
MTDGQEAWLEFASEQFAIDCGQLVARILAAGFRPVLAREAIERMMLLYIPILHDDLVALDARLASPAQKRAAG